LITTATRPAVFVGKQFLIRQKVWSFTLATQKFYIDDSTGRTVGFFARKMLKLKDDIRVFADDTMSSELLQIKARSILDFSVAFDVVDSITEERVGGIKRRGWKSIVKDEWILMDALDNEVGSYYTIDCSPPALAAFHRWIERKYGMVEELNRRWGLSFWNQEVERFNQVPAPTEMTFFAVAGEPTVIEPKLPVLPAEKAKIIGCAPV
jgi:hypothetical protein